MRLGFLLLTALLTLSAPSADAQELKSSVHRVYFLPMGNGFDQYLANQVSMQGAYEVVTDPQLADALFTDQIGLKFERQLEELYPPEPDEEEVVEDSGEEEDENADPAEDDEEKVIEQKMPISTFSRGQGNIFLVGRESRKVLWSIYHRPKNSSSKELNKAAEIVVTALREGSF